MCVDLGLCACVDTCVYGGLCKAAFRNKDIAWKAWKLNVCY